MERARRGLELDECPKARNIFVRHARGELQYARGDPNHAAFEICRPERRPVGAATAPLCRCSRSESEAGAEHWDIALRDGAVAPRPARGRRRKSLSGYPPMHWRAFQQPVPPPGCQRHMQWLEAGRAMVTGDFLTLFRYSYVLKDVYAPTHHRR